ncbi:sugar phosphate isomerase/epimerase [Chitinophaga sp. MM2321]|uniref:sugar phosphate isomerase/epimerase family protein n=1 Tax=Chitinophaga sp. MM2321 TaxID=3137178 RepID=UPI0032D5ABAD
MKNFSRREFIKLTGAGCASALVVPSFAMEAAARRSDIGATFILWGYGADALEPALKDISRLGYHAFETFGEVIEEWEEKRGGFKKLVDKYGVPIISAFCNGDVLDPSKRKEEIRKLTKWCQLLKQNGGKVIEYCATGSRKGYDYKDHKKNLVESMNEYAKVVTDQGLVCALHPHTGTPIETEEEVYFIMEHLDTNYMKFGPDVGQLEKGGVDVIKVLKDFMPLIEHVHLKDYIGGDNGYLGYCPLGEGKVDLKTTMKMLETRRNKMAGMIMFELDSDKKIKPVRSEYDAARVSADYLKKLGYRFRKGKR